MLNKHDLRCDVIFTHTRNVISTPVPLIIINNLFCFYCACYIVRCSHAHYKMNKQFSNYTNYNKQLY